MSAREQLDSMLGISEWRTYRLRKPPRRVEIEPGAPSWWHGDDEAAAPFLAWARAAGWSGES
jgi:hypothetical protein